jgi:Winged helix DNA-binding domain
VPPELLLARRLARQRLAAAAASDPAQVVAHFGAVQAQDYGQSLWAVGLRAAGSTVATVEAAIERGEILRTWPMRGTIHFVPAADARWMLELLAGRRSRAEAGILRRIGLTPDVLQRAADVVASALRGGQRIRRAELYARLTAAGIDCSASPHGGRGGHILSNLSITGLICIGPRAGAQPTFVLLDEWAPRPRTPDDPLAELAIRYFTSHGPATARDFAWWSGLNLGGARTAIDRAGPALAAEAEDGRQYWDAAAAPPGAVRGAAPGPAPDGAVLLPAFDEYTVAYQDRSPLLGRPEPGRDDGPASSDLLNPVMLLDGRPVGLWKRKAARDRVEISLAPFGRLSARDRRRLDEAAGRYAAFLGLPPAITLTSHAVIGRYAGNRHPAPPAGRPGTGAR